MELLQPRSLPDALAAKAERPEAVPIAGGTDVMVELNFDRGRPPALLDLSGVGELAAWDRQDGRLRVGAGVTYTRLIDELAGLLPGLALASRTVGSPQIRNRGTVGGNLGSASPAGDCHPVLLAMGAEVEAAAVGGVRRVPADQFFTGPKQHALGPSELIRAVHVPVATGPQQFAKIGTRNPSFTDYLIPTVLDMPPVRLDVLELGHPDAPYGLRGIGEPPTISSTPAIVAAVRAATGRPLTRVPVRPEHIVGVPAPDGDPERST